MMYELTIGGYNWCTTFTGTYDECVAYGVNENYLRVNEDGEIVAGPDLDYEDDFELTPINN